MTELDDELAIEVPAILAEYGTPLLFQTGTKVYDTSLGRNVFTKAPGSDANGNVAVLGTPPGPFDRRLVDGVAIRASDMQTMIGGDTPSTSIPREGWRVVHGGISYSTVGVSPVVSGDLVCGYIVHLRV